MKKGAKSLQQWCEENNKENILNQFSLNNKIKPIEISYKAHIKVLWKDICGHEYEMSVAHKVDGQKCPYCNNKRILKGYNDLATRYPELIKEWDFEKNILKPDEVFSQSNKKAFWKCNNGHSYESKISNRTALNRGCPTCNREKKTSVPEQTIYYYIKQVFPDAINSYIDIKNKKKIDIFIPSINTGIEYDGSYYHKDRLNNDLDKTKYFKENGIRVIRIKEYEQNEKTQKYDDIIWIPHKGNQFDNLKVALLELSILLELGSVFSNINIENDYINILNQYYTKEKNNSLSFLYPELLKEWNYEKNKDLNPKLIPATSGKKVWWKCSKCGREWKSRISHRTKRNHGCAQCSGQLPYSKEEENIIREYYPIEGLKVLNRLPYYRTEKGLKSKIGRMKLTKPK